MKREHVDPYSKYHAEKKTWFNDHIGVVSMTTWELSYQPHRSYLNNHIGVVMMTTQEYTNDKAC